MRALGLLSDVGDFAVDFLVVDSHGIGAAKVQDDPEPPLLLLPLPLLLLSPQVLSGEHVCCVFQGNSEEFRSNWNSAGGRGPVCGGDCSLFEIGDRRARGLCNRS